MDHKRDNTVILSILMWMVLVLPFVHFPQFHAIETRHGGTPIVDTILKSNFGIWTVAGHLSEEDVENMETLAEKGIKLMHVVGWWNDNITNPLDIFYNETYRRWGKEAINYSLYGKVPSYAPPSTLPAARSNVENLWAITLGDEEPAWLRYVNIYETLSPELEKYADEYHSETGYTLKPLYEITNMTEYQALVEWYNEKSVWVYNYYHDYVKSLAPHVLVFQYPMMPPVWGMPDELMASYELKGEGAAMDCYYAKEDPWLLYDLVRRYQTTLPSKEFHLDIWGTIWDFLNEAGDGLYYKEGSFEQIRRETWASYISGVDVLGYFDWAPENNNSYTWKWGHEREDKLGKKLWAYIDGLAGQLANLPVLKPEPEVLIIESGGTKLTRMNLFTEYDAVNQRCFATTNIDLSNYSMIWLADSWLYSTTTKKLNDYVETGGNLLLLRGIGEHDKSEPLKEPLAIAKDQSEILIQGHFVINGSEENLFDLDLTYEAPFHVTYALDTANLSENHHPIGDFYMIDENGTSTTVSESPLVLFHNNSLPESGWMLYSGALMSSTIPGTTWETYNFDEQLDLWNLERKIVRAYGEFLNITNSFTSKETENMIITQGVVSADTILVGISNFKNETREFTYSCDLSQLGFSSGNYWVHSLDRNQSEGHYETNGPILSFGTDLEANGTRLFLVSETKPSPSYSIDIFPPIPDIPAEPTPSDNGNQRILLILGGLAAIIVLLFIIVALMKRKSNTNG